MRRTATLVSVAMLIAAPLALAQGSGADKPKQPEKQAEAKALTVGDKAPALAIGKWVKGEPITGFEKGRVYVVEFWATWCGPCIAGMPHVTELQKEYKDKGVTVVGVNIWDEPKNVEPFMKDRGKDADGTARPTGDQLMGYTVAIEQKDDPADERNGVMSRTWMKAAGRNGIPSAFIVDQKGTIAWMGHPSTMDVPLKEVVAGTWNAERAKEIAQAEQAASKAAQQFQSFYNSGEYEKAFKVAHEQIEGAWKDNANMLNTVAWFVVDPEKDIPHRDLDLALKAAERANTLTHGKNAMIMDTLARVYFLKGDLKKALELQTKAVETNTEEQFAAEMQTRLDEYKKAAK